jgi:HD-like signal output (HDOD) protein
MTHNDKPLVELIREHLSGDLHDLPVFHSVAVRLQQLLSQPRFRINDAIEMINEDQSLASQVLKVANSTFYAGLSKVATIKDAIVRLGAQEVASMAMMASQSVFFKSDNETLNLTMQSLWVHSISCATGAKWLARKSGYPNLAAEAFMGGLLHDIGKLALLKVLDDIYRKRETNAPFSETLINEILDQMHGDVGYRLMQSWSLPEAYCAVAGNHHKPDFDGNDILLIIVRLANLACRKTGRSLHPDPAVVLFSTPEAHYLGIKEIILAELEIVIEDADKLEL